MLDRTGQYPGRSELPVYRRIAAAIRDRIASGELSAGDRLAPIRALAEELGVNRDTVALAYDQLRSEGLVEGTVGRGTFVRATVRSEPMSEPTRLRLADPIEELAGIGRQQQVVGSAHQRGGSDVVGLQVFPGHHFKSIFLGF